MEVITSKENKLYKRIIKLREKKYRDEYNQYVVEGERSVADAIKKGCNVFALVLSESAYLRKTDFNVQQNVYVFSDALFNKVTDTFSPQGVLMVLEKPTCTEVTGDVILFLDRVRDPGNVGTIIRTAVSAGLKTVVLRDCADVYSSKVARASMSALTNVNVNTVATIPEIINKGYCVACADTSGDNIFEKQIKSGKYCIVIGNEANGISNDIMDLAHLRVSIPQNDCIESLNASVAAGILTYHFTNIVNK